MNGKTRSAAIVVTGILLAVSIIGGINVLQREGLLPNISSTGQPASANSGTGTTTTTTSLASSVLSTSSVGKGILVLKIHDPPHVPPSVTAVFVTYTDIAIHASNWIDLKQSGTINLMSVVNFTQTIANVGVPAGSFDALRMNISSVFVISNSVNFSASISDNQLYAPFLGGSLVITDQSTAGAVIDIAPTVIQHTSYNASGAPTTSFVMLSSANAYVIPSNQLGQSQSVVGGREDLHNQTWLTSEIDHFKNQSSFEITSASLSNASFFLKVKNTGNTSLIIQSVFIKSNASMQLLQGGQKDEERFNIGDSILFVVLSNGTLVPYVGMENDQQVTTGIGYNLSAHSQATLSYWGKIPPPYSNGESAAEGGDGEDVSISQTNSASDHTVTISASDGELEGGGGTVTTSMSSSETTTTATISGSSSTTSYSRTTSSSSQNPYGFQLIAGNIYLVGAVSGDILATLSVAAS